MARNPGETFVHQPKYCFFSDNHTMPSRLWVSELLFDWMGSAQT